MYKVYVLTEWGYWEYDCSIFQLTEARAYAMELEGLNDKVQIRDGAMADYILYQTGRDFILHA